MSNRPTVSAVLPCHDNVNQLSLTLAGLAVQSASSALEVIVVDNNSTEPGLDQAVGRFWPSLSVTVLHQPRLPHPFALSRARNAGIALARGEWVWTLDSDCVPAPGALSALLEQVAGCPGPMMLTGERRFVDVGCVTVNDILGGQDPLAAAPVVASASNYHLARDRRFPAIERMSELPHPWDMMHGGNTVFRREDALAVGGFDERFDGHWGYEDDEFAFRVMTRTSAVPVFVPGLMVYHQERPCGGSGIDRPNKRTNPNWHLVCALIPGYREYKLATYSAHGVRVDT